MKIMIYNIKGGQGKTDIALNIAMTKGFNLLTNEPLSPVELVLPNKRFLKLAAQETCPVLPDDFDVVFDFGGYLDNRAIVALQQSDYVLVPVINEFKDVHTTVNFIQEIEEYNNKIVIIANKTVSRKNGSDFTDIKAIMAKHYPDYPIFEIKQSRALPNLLTEKKSISEMVSEGGLKRYNYTLVKEQFDAIMEVLV
jgi:cellulose biosynthesis protein BcsQ